MKESILQIKNRSYFFLISGLIFLFFFRPGVAMRVSGDFDERCYLTFAEKWVGITSDLCPTSSHFAGIAISWFPGMILAKLFSLFSSLPFDSWAAAFVGLTSFICWILSLFLISEIVQIYTRTMAPCPLKDFLESWTFPTLFLFNIPVLYFASTRALMAHSAELMWGMAFVWLLLRDKVGWALTALLILILTRPNNIGATALFLAYTVENHKKLFKTPAVPITSAFITLVVFFYLLYVLTFKGYNGTYLLPIILDFKSDKLLQILFQEDFGIVWSQTMWFFGLVFWVLFFVKGTDFFASAGVWLLASGVLTLLWPTHGSTFGYRYLIGSYPAVLLLWLEGFSTLAVGRGRVFFKITQAGLLFLAFWSLIQCWIYPAPAPYWSWTKPAHFKTGIPYGEIFSWIKMAPDLVKMNRFSEIGQFFEKLNLTAGSDFLDRGAVNQYALDGGVGNLNFIITLLVILFTAFSIYRVIRPKKFTRETPKKKNNP